MISPLAKMDSSGIQIVKDVNENEYEILKLGTQAWFAENLRVTRTPDGIPVRSYLPNNAPVRIRECGRLYDCETACRVGPHGWHLPSDDEWLILERFLGEYAGGKIKDVFGWKMPNTGATNEAGFSARPAGYYNNQGFENHFTLCCVFWSSTRQDANLALSRVLSYDNWEMRCALQHVHYGFSARCIRDS